MGAWGYKPFENDYALEWLANDVEMPNVEAIRSALQRYLSEPKPDDVIKHEVEAAIATLIHIS